MVQATPVNDIDAPGVPPGAFEFYSSGGRFPGGMFYLCPCGCGRLGALTFKPAPSPSWHFDGNRARPTLSPSVHHIIEGHTHWHGHLRAGRWESC
ncbi:MAG: DUF6527 family protein [Pseudorhodoplanes sp.]|uniref:DUF6527 family protein n=1 Tax=Pseudorhodoplanes sp. TaxID=1934341 RepID=UPI003D1069B3